jgi:hypothetical protein
MGFAITDRERRTMPDDELSPEDEAKLSRPGTAKRHRRPDVTDDEKEAFWAAVDEIQAEEPKMSVRGYIYRICGLDSIHLHGELCSKEDVPGQATNEETIQRLLLAGRREGRISYESITDGTRPTTYNERGWDNRDEAVEDYANTRQNLIDGYELSIWPDQGKRVEILSEKEALAVIVDRVAEAYQVNLTSCKGFSSESMLYEVSKRVALIGLPTVFLVLTDHDRPGYNMTEHVEREITRLVKLACGLFGRRRVPALEFVRIGLNAEQVARYRVRTRGPKSSERAGMRNYVAECAEVDFLRSVQIEEIVREGIEAQLDMDILAATRERQAADIAWLRENL